jgi:hypothetical protein
MCRTGLDRGAVTDALSRAALALLLWAGGSPPSAGQGLVALTDELRVNDFTPGWQVDADVAAHPNGSFLVVWTDFRPGARAASVHGRRFASDGSPLGEARAISDDPAHPEAHPRATVTDDGGYVVVWTGASDGSGPGIVGRRLEDDGLPVGAPFAVNTTRQGSQASAELAPTSEGGFVVVWDSRDEAASPRGRSVRCRRFAREATPQGEELVLAEVSIDSPPHPSVAASPEGRLLASWSDASGLQARAYASDGSAAADVVRLDSRLGSPKGVPSSAAAASGDGGFLVAWAGEEAGGSRRIRARRLDGDGQPVGQEWLVSLEDEGRDAAFPQVASDADGGFAIVWQERFATSDPQPSWDVYGRLFSKTGAAKGGPFRLSSTSAQMEGRPAAASTSAGGLVTVWERALQDRSDPGDVLARLWRRPEPTSVSALARSAEVGPRLVAPARIEGPQPTGTADCPNCTLVHSFKLTTLNVQLFSVIKQVHNTERARALGDDFAASPWDVVLIQEGFS